MQASGKKVMDLKHATYGFDGRVFLDNVVSRPLVLEGHGRIGEYVGGHTDWLRQRPADQPVAASAGKPISKTDCAPPPAKRKLSFKEQRELDELPKRIEQLESEITNQIAAINEPAFSRQDSSTIAETRKAPAALQADLDMVYARWSELDG